MTYFLLSIFVTKQKEKNGKKLIFKMPTNTSFDRTKERKTFKVIFYKKNLYTCHFSKNKKKNETKQTPAVIFLALKCQFEYSIILFFILEHNPIQCASQKKFNFFANQTFFIQQKQKKKKLLFPYFVRRHIIKMRNSKNLQNFFN